MWRVFCLMCMTICFILTRPFIVFLRKLKNKRNELYNHAFNNALTETEKGIALSKEYEQFLQAANKLGDNIIIEEGINAGSLVDIMRMDSEHRYAGAAIFDILSGPKRVYKFEELSLMWLSLALRMKSDKILANTSDVQQSEFKTKFVSLLLKIKVTPWSLCLKCGDSKIQVYSIFKPSTILNLVMWVKLVGLTTNIGVNSKLANKLMEISEHFISLPQVLTPRDIATELDQLVNLYMLAYAGYLITPSFYFASVWEEIGNQLVPYSNLVTILMARVEKFDTPNKLRLLPYGALDTALVDLKHRLNNHLNITINETDDLFQDLQKPCIGFIQYICSKWDAVPTTREPITANERLTLLLSIFMTLDERLRLNHV